MRPRRRWAGLTLAILLFAAPGAVAQPSEQEARERLDAIGSEIQALSQRLDVTRDARDDAEQDLREVETSLAATHRRMDALQDERRKLDDEIARLERRREALQDERRDQVEALETQLEALYRLGLSPQLKLLLNQDDPAQLDRLQTYLNHLSRARNARLDDIAELDERLADNRHELDARAERLETLSDEVRRRSAELAEQMAERQALVAKLDDRYATEQARMVDLDQDRAHAERVLREVQEALAALERPPPSTAIEHTQGELPWPVQGQVSSTFGSGEGVNRNGMVIEAGEGSPVKAVHAGRVVFADWMRGFGNLLIVDHGDGIMTLHAHLQHFEADVGAEIAGGDAIGAVGVSGGRDTPGLYFEVRRNGEPIDPQRWISRR